MKKYNIVPSGISFIKAGFYFKVAITSFLGANTPVKYRSISIYFTYGNKEGKKCQGNPEENVYI